MKTTTLYFPHIASFKHILRKKVNSTYIWNIVINLYNRVPMGCLECKNIDDAKGYTSAILGVLTIVHPLFIIPASFCLFSRKGGKQ